MTYLSVGDMAQAFRMRRHSAELQTHLTRLAEEMTSGVRSLGAPRWCSASGTAAWLVDVV